jgi:hypothetical protein
LRIFFYKSKLNLTDNGALILVEKTVIEVPAIVQNVIRGGRARWIKQLYSQIAGARYSGASVQKGKATAREIIFEHKHSIDIGKVEQIPQKINTIVKTIREQSKAGESVEDSINTAFEEILETIDQNVLPKDIYNWASGSTGQKTQLFADSDIAGYMVKLFRKIATSYGVKLTPMDLFHGHLILYGYGEEARFEAGFGILFHAKEYQSHIFEEESEYPQDDTGGSIPQRQSRTYNTQLMAARDLMIDKNIDIELETGSKASWKWSDEEIEKYDFYKYYPLARNRNKRNFLWTASNGAISVIIDKKTGKIPPSLDPRTPAEDNEPAQAVEQQLFGCEFGAINYFPGTSYEKPFVKASKVSP